LFWGAHTLDTFSHIFFIIFHDFILLLDFYVKHEFEQ
jgi:hypothetical protein